MVLFVNERKWYRLCIATKALTDRWDIVLRELLINILDGQRWRRAKKLRLVLQIEIFSKNNNQFGGKIISN